MNKGFFGFANKPIVVASAYLATATNTTNVGWQKVPIDTVDFDPYGIWDYAKKVFIPYKAGYYAIDGRARNAAVGLVAAAIYRSGVGIRALGFDTGGASIAVGGSCILWCDGTDDIALWVYTTAVKAYTNGLFDTYLQIYGPF
jgi:hypothetical protein